MPRARPALPHESSHLLPGRLCRCRLRHRPHCPRQLRRDDAQHRAARGYVLQSMADTWKDLSAGATITVAQRMNIRMASTHAIHKAREAVDFAYNAAGATAIF